MASKRASSWSDLLRELLGLILLRLHSLADRVRLGAVCRPWRCGARLHPPLPPPMPWVALGDEAYLDIVNNAVHKLKKLTITFGDARCGGSVDHLLFLTHAGGGCFLVDPFSGAARFAVAPPLVPETAALRRSGRRPWTPTWVFPEQSLLQGASEIS